MFPRVIHTQAEETFNAIERLEAALKVQHIRAFDAIYTPDGCEGHLPSYFLTAEEIKLIDEESDKLGATTLPLLVQHDNAISRLTAFSGMKNRVGKNKSQSWLNIAKNLIGWQDDASPRRKKFNIVKAPFALVWNILSALTKQVKNIARLATEYLPYLLYRYCMFGMEYAALHLEWKSITTAPQKLGYGLLYGLALTGRILFGTVFFIGQAVTSPAKNVKTSWKAGHDLADRLFDQKHEKARKVIGHLAGGIFAVLSLATTIAVYTFAMPLVIKMIGSLVVSKMPGFLSSTFQTISNGLSNAFGAVGNAVSLPIFGKIYSALGVAVSPGASGWALIGSTISTTLGLAKDKISERVQAKWYDTQGENQSKDATSTENNSVNNQSRLLLKLNPSITPPESQPVRRREREDSPIEPVLISGQAAFFERQSLPLQRQGVQNRGLPRVLTNGNFE